eukprot:g21452.t1
MFRRSLLFTFCAAAGALVSVPVATAADVDAQLKIIAQVGPNGSGSKAAREAAGQLQKHGLEVLPKVLDAMDTSNIVAANWYRVVFETIVQRAEKSGNAQLPIAEFKRIIEDPKRAGRLRRRLLTMLDRLEPAYRKQALARFLDDPEFREDAVDAALARGEAARKQKQTGEAIRAFRLAYRHGRNSRQIVRAADRLKSLGENVSIIEHMGFVTDWHLLGPFDAPGKSGFAKTFPPESNVDLDAEYVGKDRRTLRWKRYHTEDRLGQVNLNRSVAAVKEAVGYGYTELYSAKAQSAELRCGADDNITVWLNGEKVFSRLQWLNGTRLDRFTAPVKLKAGKNKLLVKVCQGPQHKNPAVPNNWSMQLRFCTPDGKGIGLKSMLKPIAKKDAAGLLTGLAIALIVADSAIAENWPQWRGIHRDGISRETNIPTVWSATKNVAWKTPLPGFGISNPIVWEDRVFVTASDGHNLSNLHVICLSRDTGKQLWHREFWGTAPSRHHNRKSSMASAAPVTDGKHVFAFFGTGDVFCLDMRGGLVWQRSLASEYGKIENRFAASSSPLLYRGTLIIQYDHYGDSFVIAINAKTGANRWKTDRPEYWLSWSSPNLVRVPGTGRDELIVAGSHKLDAYNPENGRKLWTVTGMRRECIPTPLVANGLIYAVSGPKGPTYAIRPGGKGDVTKTHVKWQNPRGAPFVPSAILVGDRYYLVDDGGIGTCLDARTGEKLWQKRFGGKFTASPVAAGGRIYFFDEAGSTLVIDGTSTGYHEIARNRFGEPVFASPAAEIEANQGQIDAALNAINRISANTTFAGDKLIDGSKAFRTTLTAADDAKLDDFRVDTAVFSGSSTIVVDATIVTAATRAELFTDFTSGGLATATTIEVAGAKGTDVVFLGKTSSLDNIEAAIDALSDTTGVVATKTDAVYGSATVTTAGSNNDLTFTDIRTTNDDNAESITQVLKVEIVTKSSGATLAVTSSSTASELKLTITLGTDATNTVTSSASDVKALLAASANSSDFVSVTYEGTGAGLVGDNVAATNITSGATDAFLTFRSSNFGSDQFVGINVLQGTLATTTASVGGSAATRVEGTDIEARINGQVAQGKGLRATLTTAQLGATVAFNSANNVAATNAKVSVTGGGSLFQIGQEVSAAGQIGLGIEGVNTARLGGISGKIFELGSGGGKSLLDVGPTNPGSGLVNIIEEAIGRVSDLRGRLGALQKNVIDTNITTLGVALESISEARSQIIDTDFAEETANLTRAQILSQSGLSVLGIANQTPSQAMSQTETLLDAALARHRRGELAEAEVIYRQIIQIDPRHADARHLSGVAAHQRGDYRAAVRHIEDALHINPAPASYHSNLGIAYRELGRIDEAVACFQRAIEIDPATAGYHYNLANAWKQAGRLTEAVASYCDAVAMSPEFAEAHNNLGDALAAQDEPGEAIRCFRRAIELSPGFADAWFNLGNVQRRLEQFSEAANSYHRAVQLDSSYVAAWINLGYTCEDLGSIDQAIECYDAALRAEPENADAHFNRALAWLQRGDYAKGWAEYEWRWRRSAKDRKRPAGVEWDGTALKGKAVYVYNEQGIGDELMFASCLPELLKQGAAGVRVECDPRLAPLLKRSFPAIQFLPRHGTEVLQVPTCEQSVEEVQVALGSLPKAFRSTIADFPNDRGYLHADPTHTDAWRQRYRALGDGIAIGISWRGGKDETVRRRRSTTLEQWRPVFEQAGAHLINLQYGECRADIERAEKTMGVEIVDWPDADPLRDLDGFAAKIAALDLVISVDNSTVHMAGALGIPVWTLLPATADWRWQTGRDDSPWYPGMRLFRQPVFGDWESVFRQVADELARRTTVRKTPDAGELNNLAIELQAQGRHEEALAHLLQARKIAPADAVIPFNLGNLYRRLNEPALAVQSFDESLAINPDSIETQVNRGVALREAGELADAETAFDRVLSTLPELPIAHFNRSLVRLQRGDFMKGWPEYEWRWRTGDTADPSAQMLTERFDLSGRKLLLRSEQGIGDEIMFASCIPEVAEAAESCIVECDRRLVPLIRRSFPRATVLPKPVDITRPIRSRDTSAEIEWDLSLPCGSLPMIFRKDVSSFPERESYLVPEEDLVERWRRRFETLGNGLKVGISYSGGKDLETRRRRSIALEQWGDIFDVAGVDFVNLQYGQSPADLRRIGNELGVEIHHWRESDPLADVDGFAAQIAALDLVISVDNSTVHLAGALGTPVWTLLPCSADWRWIQGRDDSLWYPSMTLIRQTKTRDWSAPLQVAATRLAEWVVFHAGPGPVEELVVRIERPLDAVRVEQSVEQTRQREAAILRRFANVAGHFTQPCFGQVGVDPATACFVAELLDELCIAAPAGLFGSGGLPGHRQFEIQIGKRPVGEAAQPSVGMPRFEFFAVVFFDDLGEIVPQEHNQNDFVG